MSFPFESTRSIRLAKPEDILRMGIAATCGFECSPIFAWQRPLHLKYPGDTLLSYPEVVSKLVQDWDYLVYVAVDKYDPDEAAKSGAVIPPNNGVPTPAAGEEVIVGLAAWKIAPGPRIENGNGTGMYPKLEPNLNRDKDLEHFQRMMDASKVSEKLFLGMMKLGLLAVHPAYQRRGHGSALVHWGIAASNRDKSKTGVTATMNAVGLYEEMGFKGMEGVEDFILDDQKGLFFRYMVHDPTI